MFSIKSRGCGKYEIAKKIAIALIKNAYVCVQPPVNFKELTRQQITILEHLDIGQVQMGSKINSYLDSSSSTSTLSVDETDTSPVSSSESSTHEVDQDNEYFAL